MLQYFYQLQLLKTKNTGATANAINNPLLSGYSPALLQQQLLSTYALQQQQQQQQFLKSLDINNFGALMNSLTPEQLALFGLNPLAATPTTTSTATTTSTPTSSSSTSSSTTQKTSSTAKSVDTDHKASTTKNKPTTNTTEKVHILPNLHDGK